MAALNFPNSPSTNDLHTENGVTFKWNGTIWKKVGPAYTDTTNLNVTGISTFSGGIAGDVSIGQDLTFVRHITLADKIIHNGDTDTMIRFPGANTITAETAGSERVRITSTGVVSINDSTPETFATLQVKNHTGSNAAQFLLHGADMAQIILRDETGGSNTKCTTIRNDQGAFLVGTHNDSYGGFSEKLRILSDGKFGIGVTPISIFHVRPLDETNFLVRNEGSTVVLASETNNGRDNNRGMALEATQFEFIEGGSEKVRIDGSGRVLIGSTAKAGDSVLQVYTSDRKHPAIRAHSPNANGFTILSDAYTADESNLNLGLAYSSASVVLGFGCKPSDSADNAFLSSQDTYSTRPCALKMGTEGDLRFYTTETNSTRTTDSAVSLTEVFSIDRVGNIRQKISSRYMYFGANQELQVGVNGSDPYVNAAAGDLMIRDAGNAITNIRSDGLQMYQDIYFATAGKGIVLGNTSNVDANTLDDYEEGDLSWQLRKSGATGQGSNNGSVVKYTKVGRMVHISGKIRTDSTGSNSGDNFYLDGTLPFAASANGTAVIGHFRSQDDNSGTLTASLAWMAGSSTVYIYTCVTRSDYTANENNVGCNNQTNLVITFSFAYNAS